MSSQEGLTDGTPSLLNKRSRGSADHANHVFLTFLPVWQPALPFQVHLYRLEAGAQLTVTSHMGLHRVCIYWREIRHETTTVLAALSTCV